MTNESTNPPNSIKYSIWETRTDEIDPRIKEKLAQSQPRRKPMDHPE
ncbi:hypothetical protein PH210_25655 [Paenibacillus sp. BSR1-1]|nr:hypothetical protein [Paenibacillus sp. BSR1-1]MDN3019554.1 hypothetical protein [Paenibacillus sp. BSR1-1]